MNTTTRNSFVINNAFRSFFLASVLSSIVAQLNILVDGIIVSHVVSADAISAVNLASPIMMMILLVANMIASGTYLMMAGEIGDQNYKQVDRIFTVGMSSIFIINLSITIALYASTNMLANLLTSEERLLPLIKDYLPISFIGAIVFAIQLALTMFVKVSGRPGLVTRCIIVGALGNVILDLLLVVSFDMGMRGAALASCISALLSLLVFVPYLSSADKPFRFVSLRGGWHGALFRQSLVRGVPAAIGTITMAALMLGLNTIILKSQGPNGMFILSVCLQVLMISMLVMGGAGSAITGIGGVLMGEQDNEGVYLLVKKIFKLSVLGAAIFSAIAIMFPSLLARLFGASDELLSVSEEPLRVFSFIIIPMGLIIPLSSLFMILNRNTMASMISIGMVVCILPLVLLTSLFAPQYLWHSLPAGMWLIFLFTAITTWCISRRSKDLHWLYLINKSSHHNAVTYSVNYEVEDIVKKLNELLGFIEKHNLPQALHLRIHHCLEELMCNEIEMARSTKKRGTFDITVTNQDNMISVIVKDVGKPYNPVIKYKTKAINKIEDIDESQLSMALIDGLCENITYKYMNGVNCLYLRFDK